MQFVLTPELIIEAYARGLFPMAYSGDSPYIHWVCPDMRGQLSIPDIHIPRRLQKTLRRAPYDVRINSAFRAVMEGCAQTKKKRPETWINPSIIDSFCTLHEQGHAHSVECWQDGALVGGVYGLALGGAFFGESMFQTARDASKIALIHLTARLWRGGFTIFDTQFTNDHLEQFGVYEVPHETYISALRDALDQEADFQLTGQTPKDILDAYFESRAQNQA